MDSGSAVPTLRPGLSETVAAKLLTVASGRWGVVVDTGLVDSVRAAVAGALLAAFMLLRKARFLADERAGKSSAARAAMMAMTTMSSMSVKARPQRILISHLVGFRQENHEHGRCQGV